MILHRWMFSHPLLPGFALAGVSLVVSSCSLKQEDRQRVTIVLPQSAVHSLIASRTGMARVAKDATDSTRTSLESFDCYAVNVTGDGVPADSTIGGTACASAGYFGAMAGTVSRAGGNLDVIVNGGTKRNFQLWGAMLKNGQTQCPTLAQIKADPGTDKKGDLTDPMLLGSTTADVVADSSVTIVANFDPTQPIPVFCDSKSSAISSAVITRVDATPTSLTVHWTDAASDATNFRLESSLDSTTWTAVATVPAGVLNYTVSGIPVATSYYFRVIALSASVESIPSAAYYAITSYLPPTPPTYLAVTIPVGTSLAQLTWVEPTPVGSYGKLFYTIKQGTAVGQETVLASSISGFGYTDSSILTPGTTYYYTVTAAGSGGESPPAADASITPVAVPHFTNGSGGTGQASLTWNQAAGATQFKVQRSSTPGLADAISIYDGPLTTFNDSGLSGGITYYYQIKGYNPTASSAFSDGYPVTPSGAGSVPTKIAFAAQPAGAISGTQLSMVTVQLEDSSGNLVNGAGTVTLSLINGDGRGVLNGTLSRNFTGGIANFTDLQVNHAAAGYSLKATTAISGTPVVAITSAFNITAGSPNHLAFSSGRTITLANNACAGPFSIAIMDANDNPSSVNGGTIQLSGNNGNAYYYSDDQCTAANGSNQKSLNLATPATTSPEFYIKGAGSPTVVTATILTLSKTATIVMSTPASILSPKLATGPLHTCAIVNGAVNCWGDNTYGQLGVSSASNSPVPNSVTGATGIATGNAHSCAVTGGTIKCWGKNDYGQLGDGTTTARYDTLTPILRLTAGVTAVAAGTDFTCAIQNGGVFCWGINTRGQLGSFGYVSSAAPIQVIAQGSGVNAIVAGDSHACALGLGGVRCWGANEHGQLGDGSNVDRFGPVDAILPNSAILRISAGTAHTCASSYSAVTCWGANDHFQQQTNAASGTDILSPTAIGTSPVGISSSGLGTSIIGIGGGANHVCVLGTYGMNCWGADFHAQLGDSLTSDAFNPVYFPAIAATAVSSAGGEHTCIITNDAHISCWGANGAGQLGRGTTTPYESTPHNVNGL